jgi:hypothetical protein
LFYGFQRQPDGTYADPFLVAVDDNREALFNPFGQSVRIDSEDEATYLFSFNDWGGESIDDGSDVFTTTIQLGTPNTLGKYTPTAEGFTKEWLNPVPVGFPSDAGTQGNPDLFTRADGEVDSIWVENEYDGDASQDMFVCISVVGEPRIGRLEGQPHLFFVYALLRAYSGGSFGDINMQIGSVQL